MKESEGENLLVPCMHHSLIPIPQPRFHLALPLFLFAGLELLQQKMHLLAECMKRPPPMGALVLVSVPDEELVEEGVDVVQHCFFMLRCVHEGCGRDLGGCGRHGDVLARRYERVCVVWRELGSTSREGKQAYGSMRCCCGRYVIRWCGGVAGGSCAHTVAEVEAEVEDIFRDGSYDNSSCNRR
jgi:hypothetical protein